MLFSKIKSMFCKKDRCLIKETLKKSAFMLDMKRRNKFITFFALFFIAAYFCMPSMESIIKKVVHKYGSEITGTDVNLKRVSLKLGAGEARVRGITIKNPKEYKSKNLFALNEIKVQLNISSLTSDTIIIENVLIDSPSISYEMLSLTQNNIKDVLNNVEAYTAQKPQTAEGKSNSNQKKSSGNEKKVIINNLEVINGKIEVTAGFGEFKTPISLSLPKIRLQNIGKEKQGNDITQTLQIIIRKILDTATTTVINSGSLQNFGQAAVENLKNSGKEAIESGKNTLKEFKNIFAK